MTGRVRKPQFLRAAYYRLYRARLRSEWWLRDRFESAPAGVVLPPARLRFRVGEDSSASAFLSVGERTSENLEASLKSAGLAFRPGEAVLDFGCGCGRTLLWLARRFPEVQWHGTDVDADAVAWCRAHIATAQFTVNAPLPPLSYPEGKFDLIYGVSVFTHLAEEFQRAWTNELYRVLRPGGALLLSFYGEHVWRTLPQAKQIAQSAFVFQTSAKHKGILPDWYHTALQNRARIVALLGGRFSDVRYLERALGDHDVAIARKG